jgi:hypothetical protein
MSKDCMPLRWLVTSFIVQDHHPDVSYASQRSTAFFLAQALSHDLVSVRREQHEISD